jgi:hypothetical protein
MKNDQYFAFASKSSEIFGANLTMYIAALLLILPMVAFGGEQPWAFVQSIGGLTLGAPTRIAHGWALPVNVNVSGLEALTRKPTMLNSALICDSTNVAVNGNLIYLTISTASTRSDAL